jgi:hypothetical protein
MVVQNSFFISSRFLVRALTLVIFVTHSTGACLFCLSPFDLLRLVCMTLDPTSTGSYRPRHCSFEGDKNPQHAFLRKGWRPKAVGPMRYDLRYVKYHLQVGRKILRKAKFIIPFARSSCLVPADSAGRTDRELWWTNQEFSSDDIMPLWF